MLLRFGVFWLSSAQSSISPSLPPLSLTPYLSLPPSNLSASPCWVTKLPLNHPGLLHSAAGLAVTLLLES
uniref:Uncharacterized protein n=1 Tax=Anguilla anguilla TaxID=7936 RepID=A0A0E9U100_ANGAN